MTKTSKRMTRAELAEALSSLGRLTNGERIAIGAALALCCILPLLLATALALALTMFVFCIALSCLPGVALLASVLIVRQVVNDMDDWCDAVYAKVELAIYSVFLALSGGIDWLQDGAAVFSV